MIGQRPTDYGQLTRPPRLSESDGGQATDNGLQTTDNGLTQCLSAVRTKGKIPINGPSAGRADILRRRLLEIRAWAVLIDNGFAVFAEQERGAPLDWKQRDKEQAHVMVHPLEIDPHMPA